MVLARNIAAVIFSLLGNALLIVALLAIAAWSLVVLRNEGIGEFLYLFAPTNWASLVAKMLLLAPGVALIEISKRLHVAKQLT